MFSLTVLLISSQRAIAEDAAADAKAGGGPAETNVPVTADGAVNQLHGAAVDDAAELRGTVGDTARRRQ